jgi:hypothetical protein
MCCVLLLMLGFMLVFMVQFMLVCKLVFMLVFVVPQLLRVSAYLHVLCCTTAVVLSVLAPIPYSTTLFAGRG